ncbi:MFS general substrate transporter [Dissoconium aciculare CBS 342.82]|uniref:MFS general substrate transporter n=1 Tax=Dissoconium aciculare CBS 342.82 TaxID=1314786 RepID=A0A6J3M2S4_9PEZI|nr:MFS general substrate transporter [Dissoconium aciculare CBS 342.82]KAF1822290.1 MFS general substrate transporter [Dissoconium aciculare CBS 342.82]
MNTSEAVFEAEVDLNGQRSHQRRQQHDSQMGAQGSRTRPTAGDLKSREESDIAGEETALLRSSMEEQDALPLPSDVDDFAGFPWYKRPSIWWVIGPFFLLALAFGGIITPKMNLMLDLVCREYFAERQRLDPGFTLIPVDFNNGENEQCRIPEVQSRVAALATWGSLITGVLSAIISPKLGSLSDRYGRKPILILSSMGTMLGETVTIVAANFPETFPSSLLLLGYAFDGLLGSFILAMTISNAYITDCTTPQARSIGFGYLHACLFAGVALSPILAGILVKVTGQIITVFYIAIAVHIAFILYMAFIVPESLSKRRQEDAQKRHVLDHILVGPEWDVINSIRAMNILEPLKILYPTGPGTTSALRSNLVLLASVDTIVFGVAMGVLQVLILYLNYQFGWTSYDSGVFISIVNTSRVLGLVVVLPLITHFFRNKKVLRHDKGSDEFDLGLIRLAIFFDTVGFLGYTLARTGPLFTLAGVAASLGGIGSPTLQSALTKHVPAERTGQLLGALGLLHALARIVSPTVFGIIYASTVGKFTQTVFLCLCATFGLAFVLSWFIRPHVYYEDQKLSDDAADDDDAGGVATGAGPAIATASSLTAVTVGGR